MLQANQLEAKTVRIIITINQTPVGDIEAKVSREAGYQTDREGVYVDAIQKSVFEHLKAEIPRIAKTLGAQGAMQLNPKPGNS